MPRLPFGGTKFPTGDALRLAEELLTRLRRPVPKGGLPIHESEGVGFGALEPAVRWRPITDPDLPEAGLGMSLPVERAPSIAPVSADVQGPPTKEVFDVGQYMDMVLGRVVKRLQGAGTLRSKETTVKLTPEQTPKWLESKPALKAPAENRIERGDVNDQFARLILREGARFPGKDPLQVVDDVYKPVLASMRNEEQAVTAPRRLHQAGRTLSSAGKLGGFSPDSPQVKAAAQKWDEQAHLLPKMKTEEKLLRRLNTADVMSEAAPGGTAPSPDDVLSAREEERDYVRKIKQVVEFLQEPKAATPRQRQIVGLRMGFDNPQGAMTQSQVAKALKIDHKTVGEAEEAVLSRLRKKLGLPDPKVVKPPPGKGGVVTPDTPTAPWVEQTYRLTGGRPDLMKPEFREFRGPTEFVMRQPNPLHNVFGQVQGPPLPSGAGPGTAGRRYGEVRQRLPLWRMAPGSVTQYAGGAPVPKFRSGVERIGTLSRILGNPFRRRGMSGDAIPEREVQGQASFLPSNPAYTPTWIHEPQYRWVTQRPKIKAVTPPPELPRTRRVPSLVGDDLTAKVKELKSLREAQFANSRPSRLVPDPQGTIMVRVPDPNGPITVPDPNGDVVINGARYSRYSDVPHKRIPLKLQRDTDPQNPRRSSYRVVEAQGPGY